MADNREPPETVADEKELFVMALSEFFKGYATIREARHVPVTASMKAKNLLSISQIVLTTLMGVRDPKAPMEIFTVSSERPDPRKGLLRELTNGTLVTIGYLLPRSVNDRPVVIPSEYWLNANPNFDENALAAAGLDFVQVQVVFNDVGGYPEVQQGNGWVIRPLPELARFGPSEAFRQRWDLPAVEADQVANTMPEIGVDVPEQAPHANEAPPPPQKIGRPTYQAHIVAAFSAIEKDLNWTEKQLSAAVRDRVKADIGKVDDKGLGDDAILKHVRPMWHGLKNSPR
jgi:hypothetical protein